MISENSFQIHETAQIGRGVVLSGSGVIGANVKIGAYAILDGHIEIGSGTIIDPHVVIAGSTFIGMDNCIHSFCSFGTAPQYAGWNTLTPTGCLRIGNGNTFREYNTIHMPTTSDATLIGDNCYFMAYCDTNHDVVIGDNVKLGSGCTLAGHVRVDSFSYLGMHSAVHQHCRIGSCSMIGMNSAIVKDVLPYSTIVEQKFYKINKRGMKMNSIGDNTIKSIEDFYANFRAEKHKEELTSVFDESEARLIIEFMRSASRPYYEPDFAQVCRSSS